MEIRKIQSDEELKIFSDPYRMRIINAYIKASKPLTVKGVADIMGEVPAKVHYHVKKLLTIDILTLDHTEVINGITAKYYRLTAETFEISYANTPSHSGLFDSTTNMLISMVDDFKEDIYRNANYIKKHDGALDIPRKGFITKETLRFNEEEYQKFTDELQALYKKYRINLDVVDPTRDDYEFFVSWVRKLED